MPSTGFGQLSGVVAVWAADHDNNIASPGKFLRGILTLFGGLADCVHKADLGLWEPGSKPIHQGPDPLDRLGGLGGDPKPIAGIESVDVRLLQNDIIGIQVPGQTPDLDMVPLTNDHWMIAGPDQRQDPFVGEADQWAGGLDHPMTSASDDLTLTVGGPVGRDHHGVGLDIRQLGFDPDPELAKIPEDRLIVDQVSKDRQRTFCSGLVGEGQGVPDAEAHAEVDSLENLHAL